jgi:hypothetical protein
MPGEAERPHFKRSILQLEALFDQARTSIETLQVLDHELSYRTTARAGKLRSNVSDLIEALSMNAAIGGGLGAGSPATPTAAMIAFPKNAIREQPSQPARKQEKEAAPIVVPPTEKLGDLPSFPTPKGANDHQRF